VELHPILLFNNGHLHHGLHSMKSIFCIKFVKKILHDYVIACYLNPQLTTMVLYSTGSADGGGLMGNGWMGTITKVTTGGVIGWIIGSKYHTKKLSKKLYEQHKNDQKKLYTQYYNDVYTLQKQNSELIDALEEYIMVSGDTIKPSQKKVSSTSTTRR
jgi:hypothetical protein